MNGKKVKKRKYYTLVSLAILFFLLLVSVFVVSYFAMRMRSDSRDKAKNFGDNVVNSIVTNFMISSSVNNIWKSILIGNDGKVEDFDKFSSIILSSQKGIKSIYLAPDGIVSYIYPPTTENSEDMHLDLLNYSNTRKVCEAARDYKNYAIFVSDNLSLEDGLFMYCDPVFIPDATTGEEVFWGFAMVIIDITDIVDVSKMQTFLAMGYDCRIYHRDYLNGGIDVVYKSSNNTSDDVVRIKIPYLASDWNMEIFPKKGGWVKTFSVLGLLSICLIVSFLIPFAVYLVLYLADKDKIMTRFSYTDTLTGLGNSRCFLYYLDHLQKMKKPYGVLYMDLNDFKPVNDTYGHNAGDQILTIVGKKLDNCIRTTDSAYRIGGDEFAVIVEGYLNHHVYEALIDRIKDSVARPVVLSESRVVKVGASIGFCASSLDCSEGYESVVKQAEVLMYKDKKESKAGR